MVKNLYNNDVNVKPWPFNRQYCADMMMILGKYLFSVRFMLILFCLVVLRNLIGDKWIDLSLSARTAIGFIDAIGYTIILFLSSPILAYLWTFYRRLFLPATLIFALIATITQTYFSMLLIKSLDIHASNPGFTAFSFWIEVSFILILTYIFALLFSGKIGKAYFTRIIDLNSEMAAEYTSTVIFYSSPATKIMRICGDESMTDIVYQDDIFYIPKSFQNIMGQLPEHYKKHGGQINSENWIAYSRVAHFHLDDDNPVLVCKSGHEWFVDSEFSHLFYQGWFQFRIRNLPKQEITS